MKGAATIGSDLFGTSTLKAKECIDIARVSVSNGRTAAQANAEISFIDDCLSMRRMVQTYGSTKHAVLTATGRVRKNSTYIDFVNKRLDQFVKELDQLTPLSA